MTEKNIDYYRKQFYEEASEILEKVYEDIIKAEAEPDNIELLNSLFRNIHTIKGSAGTFEMEDISSVSHHLEGILNLLRKGGIALTPDLVDVMLAGTDHIGRLLDAHCAGKKLAIDENLVNQLNTHRESFEKKAESKNEPMQTETLPDSDAGYQKLPVEIQDQLRKAAIYNFNVFCIVLNYTSEHLENGYDPVILLKSLNESSRIYYAQPPTESESFPVPALLDFEPMALYLKSVIYVATELSYEEILNLAFDSSLITIEKISTEQTAAGQLTDPEAIDSESMTEFIVGTSEMLEAAETAIIEFEKTGSVPALNEIFRVVHNIKGDADFIGLKKLTEFSHALESLLEKVRSGFVVGSNVVDIILSAIDYFKQTINKLAQGSTIDFLPPVYEEIKKIIKPQQKTVKETSGELSGFDSEIKKVLSDQLIQYKAIMQSKMTDSMLFEPDQKKVVLRLLKGILNAGNYVGLSKLQTLSTQAVEALKGDDQEEITRAVQEIINYIGGLGIEPKRIGEILIQEGKITEDELFNGLAKQKPIGEILVDDGKVTQEDVLQALKKQELMGIAKEIQPTSSEQELRTMRVDEQKIDHLTNISGELLIARNNYDYLLNQLISAEGLNRETIKSFKDNLHLFTRLAGDIHHGIMSLRMVPVGGVFRKFTRVVRDISRKQKKSIELAIEGEEIEIDKKAADALTDPLVHLIRNACDHGIEPVSERLESGKPEKGMLILKATQEGSNLCINIKDDGRGINRQKIYEKAVKIGIQNLSPEDPAILNHIFVPGLSTLSEATEMSGRGVGMDVVKTTVQSLGGSVHVASEERKGTEIHLVIPMTMGIDEVLLVETKQRLYAIPLSSIMETLKIPYSKIKRAVHQLLFYYRGEIIPLVHLDSLLDGLHRVKTMQQTNFLSVKLEVSVAVIKTAKGKIGVIVDRFNKNMELSIKPLPRQLSGLDIFSGISIMGDGRIILVLNPGKLT